MNQDKKLQKAFDQGYLIGANDTHENWMLALRETPGIGKKRREQIIETMTRLCREKMKT